VAPDYALFDETETEVVLMSGLPGVGKDFYLLDHYRDWPVVSLDALRRTLGISPTDQKGNGRVVQAAKEQARVYLRRRQPFVWNATNITRAMRSQLIDLFTTYRASVRLVYVEVQNSRRMEQNAGRQHLVPEAAVRHLLTRWEVPAPWEAHDVAYIV